MAIVLVFVNSYQTSANSWLPTLQLLSSLPSPCCGSTRQVKVQYLT